MNAHASPRDVGRRVALVTDSSSQITAELAEEWKVTVVPITVEIDGDVFQEGVDLDADGFFDRFRPGESTVVSSQPSPATFAGAYAEAEAEGAEAILGVHVGAALSGTLNAARVAARGCALPVQLVDSGMASFGVTYCLLAAAEQLASGAGLSAAATTAEETAAEVESVFILQGLELVRAGGRLGAAGVELSDEGVSVLHTGKDLVEVVGSVHDLDAAVALMAETVLAVGSPVRVASGLADAATLPVTEALVKRLERESLVTEMLHYRVGPSVAAHTGPGTAGVFFTPDRRS